MIKLCSAEFFIVILAYISFIQRAGGRDLLQFDLSSINGPTFGASGDAEIQETIPITAAAFQPVDTTIQDFVEFQPQAAACTFLEGQNFPSFTLSQSDFTSGTKIISEPGIYSLTSDITFNPNGAEALGVEPYFASDVQPEQFEIYDPQAYGIGFFAAIAVTTDNVIIDLNGHTMVQGEEHALNQRFFSLIELGSSPFVNGQGPHFFGVPTVTPNNICIKNGVLGRAAHNGIHGNNNTNVEIRDLTIKDYEVGAIQLNLGKDVLIENIDVPYTRFDVPVMGRFSAARFIRPWVNQLVNGGYTGTLNVGGKILTAQDVQNDLRNAINEAANEVLRFGRILLGDQRALFGNPSGIPDGSAIYGIITNFNGVAVNGFPNNVPLELRAQRIVIRNVRITKMELEVHEIPAMTIDPEKKLPATDAVGAAVETQDGFTVTSSGVYVGNPVANAQLMVAKAQNDNFDFGLVSSGRKQIGAKIVEWAESGQPYADFGITYLCNADLMFHVNKGPVAFKLDASNDVKCENCVVDFVRNTGDIGSTLCNDNQAYVDGTGKSNVFATQFGYGGGACRGFSLSSTSNALLTNCAANVVLANAGDAIGFDITFGSSQITIVDSFAGMTQGGTSYFPFDYENNPTPLPISVAINQDDSVSGVSIE